MFQMKSSVLLFVIISVITKNVYGDEDTAAASFSGFNNRASVLKTCKTCAQQNGLDIKTTTSIYGRGNFDEATDANKCYLKCIGKNLKLWVENEEPNYDKIMQHAEFLVIGDKKGLREKMEVCVESSSNEKNFCNRLFNAYKCFWTATKGLGRQHESLLEKLKIEFNKKI